MSKGAALKIKPQTRAAPQTASPEAKRHGRYRKTTVYVFPSDGSPESGNFKVEKNYATSVIDDWLNQDEPIFEPHEVQMICLCKHLWDNLGLIDMRLYNRGHSSYGRLMTLSGRDDYKHMRALNRLSTMKKRVSSRDWSIFENVIRWDEPTGFPGSKYSSASAAALSRTQSVIKRVLEAIR